MSPINGATMIMVIRHAEKPGTYNSQSYDGVDALGDTCGKDGKESLVTLGWERADGLVTLFAPPWGPKPCLGKPAYIYAADPGSSADDTTGAAGAADSSSASDGDSHSQRPYETVSAVAQMLGVTIDAKHKKSDYAKVVSDALAKPGVVLICWQHQDIGLGSAQSPGISQCILTDTGTTGTLGIPTTKWPGDRYDLVWVFNRPSGQERITSFLQVPQMLLPGGSTTVISD